MGHYILAGDGSLIIERRSTPRYDVSLGVQIGVVAGSESVPGTITNLSESGAQIVLPMSVAKGDLLDVACSAFRGTGEIVWCRDEGNRMRIGMKFVSLTDEARSGIRDVLARASGQEAPHAEASRGGPPAPGEAPRPAEMST